MSIPLDVLNDILLRLPTQSLFRFKTVCKEWRRLIDDPSFIRSRASTYQDSSTLCLVVATTSGRASFYYLPLDSLEFVDGVQTIAVTHVETSMRCNYHITSCNGLKLGYRYEGFRHKHQLWNPLTREFHTLPQLCSDGIFKSVGVGYDCATDDYKVVWIVRLRSSPVFETRVYSLKSSSWKRIKNCPDDVYDHKAIYANGSLHWRSKGKIIALDLRTKDYRELPEPPRTGGRISKKRLTALCGSLVLSCCFMFSRYAGYKGYEVCIEYEGWMMKEDGRWMALYRFGDMGMNMCIRPIAYLKSKGQIILREGEGPRVLHWLDIKNNIRKKFTIEGLPKFTTCHICPGSLFRLDRSCELERKRKKMVKYDWRFMGS